MKQFICVGCLYVSKKADNIHEHYLARHSLVKGIICSECDFTTLWFGSMRRHKKRHK